MTRTIDAMYEGGVLRPLQALEGIPEHSRVRLTVVSAEVPGQNLAECVGTLPDEDAAEMREIIDREFEQVNPLRMGIESR